MAGYVKVLLLLTVWRVFLICILLVEAFRFNTFAEPLFYPALFLHPELPLNVKASDSLALLSPGPLVNCYYSFGLLVPTCSKDPPLYIYFICCLRSRLPIDIEWCCWGSAVGIKVLKLREMRSLRLGLLSTRLRRELVWITFVLLCLTVRFSKLLLLRSFCKFDFCFDSSGPFPSKEFI